VQKIAEQAKACSQDSFLSDLPDDGRSGLQDRGYVHRKLVRSVP
jgi:hypothetical protein